MSDLLNGPAGRVARLRQLMESRGYHAVVVRDEANLRWLTGAMRVFDYTGEFPHVAFITSDSCFLHTDSRYFNAFEENLPEGDSWSLDIDSIEMPLWSHIAPAIPRAVSSPSRMISRSASTAV